MQFARIKTRPVCNYGKENAVKFTDEQLSQMLIIFGGLSFVIGCLLAVI